MNIDKLPYCPSPQNIYFENPVIKGDNLNFYNGYEEMFYKIDFIEGLTKTYFVSSYGRFFCLEDRREISIRQHNKSGNMRVSFNTVKTRKYDQYVQKCVAMAFIPKEIEDIELGRNNIIHLDGNPTNNIMWNLKWANRSEINFLTNKRMKEGYKRSDYMLEKKGLAKGEDVYSATLTSEQVHIICQLASKGLSTRECCIEIGLEATEANIRKIRNILTGDTWAEITANYPDIIRDKKNNI